MDTWQQRTHTYTHTHTSLPAVCVKKTKESNQMLRCVHSITLNDPEAWLNTVFIEILLRLMSGCISILLCDLCACVCVCPPPLTTSPRGFPRVGIHSADVDQTVFLVVDPHFGVIDDAGYHPVCVGFSRVCVVIYTSKGACQTHNHDSMQVHATKFMGTFG